MFRTLILKPTRQHLNIFVLSQPLIWILQTIYDVNIFATRFISHILAVFLFNLTNISWFFLLVEDRMPRTYTVIIIVLGILLGITWLLLTIFIIFKIRRGCLQTTKTSIYLDTENVMQSYQNLQDIEGETNYTNIDRSDHETQYVELDIS